MGRHRSNSRHETAPQDWAKGLIVRLAKKGDFTECGNWCGITLMAVPVKVMGRVIVNRMRKGVDKRLRKDHAGFRIGRNTIEQIFTLRKSR